MISGRIAVSRDRTQRGFLAEVARQYLLAMFLGATITVSTAMGPAILLPKGHLVQRGVTNIDDHAVGFIWISSAGVDRLTAEAVGEKPDAANRFGYIAPNQAARVIGRLSLPGIGNRGIENRYIIAAGLPFRAFGCFAEGSTQLRWHGGFPLSRGYP